MKPFIFRDYIECAGHTCELRDAAEFQSAADVVQLISQNPPFDGALAIHLFKAGRLLLGEHPFTYRFSYWSVSDDVWFSSDVKYITLLLLV